MSGLLVDTSIWIDHLRRGEEMLRQLLLQGRVLGHPMITGEIALGSLADRASILRLLQNLPQATRATDAEVLGLIEGQALFGLGLGLVDVHLLAATLLTPGARIWTRDRKLGEAAATMGIAAAVDRQS